VNATVPAKQSSGAIVQLHCQHLLSTTESRDESNEDWQNVSGGNLLIRDKNGGLNNTSTYIGFAPQSKLGVVILVNRGKQHATGIGRQILHALAQEKSEPSNEGEPDPDAD
jgi:hypothetical protein